MNPSPDESQAIALRKRHVKLHHDMAKVAGLDPKVPFAEALAGCVEIVQSHVIDRVFTAAPRVEYVPAKGQPIEQAVFSIHFKAGLVVPFTADVDSQFTSDPKRIGPLQALPHRLRSVWFISTPDLVDRIVLVNGDRTVWPLPEPPDTGDAKAENAAGVARLKAEFKPEEVSLTKFAKPIPPV